MRLSCPHYSARMGKKLSSKLFLQLLQCCVLQHLHKLLLICAGWDVHSFIVLLEYHNHLSRFTKTASQCAADN